MSVEIGRRLERERERKKIARQSDFAELGGVAVSTYANYIKGTRTPDAEALALWYQNGIDVLYVLTGRVDEGSLSPVEMDLLVNFRTLDDRGRAGVLGMIRGYNLAQPAGEAAAGVRVKGDVGQVVNGGQIDQSQATFTVGGGRKKK